MNQLNLRPVSAFDLEAFEKIVGPDSVRRVRTLARKVRREFCGRSGKMNIWHINSSAVGGGVADILNFLVPFADSMGMPTRWFVIGGDEKFFKITKTFHNVLQGSDREKITNSMFSHYRSITDANAAMLERLCDDQRLNAPDVIVIHDPQPAGLIPHLRRRYPDARFVWRGHIHFDFQSSDCEHPGRRVWSELVGFVNQSDAAVFHLPEQVPPGITIPVRCILPSINPLALINRDLSGAAAARFIDDTLTKYGLKKLHDRSVPLVIQNARFDPWKDPQGVIQAFREARASISSSGKTPHLVLVGPLAADDPQASEILDELSQTVSGDPAIHVIPIDPVANDLTPQQARSLGKLGLEHKSLRAEHVTELEINAFQTRADIIIAKSLREGFGMAVTGAGYHGKARVVSEIGGLAAQVTDDKGNAYAFLTGRASEFSRDTSIRMTRDAIVRLLSSETLRESMGAKAKRHVLQNFLPHRHLEDYLKLFLDLR